MRLVRPPKRLTGSLRLSRRGLLRAAGIAASAVLGGCGREGAQAAPGGLLREAGDPKPAFDANAVSAFLSKHPLPPRYRSQQQFLLQGVPARTRSSGLPDGRPFDWDRFGPTHLWVDAHTGWAWSRPGGDWLDAKGVRYGTEPWLRVSADGALAGETSAHYFADVTRLVQHVEERKHWLALLVVAKGAPRTLAGTADTRLGPPAIDVEYADGTRARLACRLAAHLSPSSTRPLSAATEVNLPAALEFDRPSAPVRSAKLRFAVAVHWSGRQSQIEAFLLDPVPLPEPAAPAGLSPGAARLDADLSSKPSIIGVHRYLDGSRLSDFLHAEGASLHSAYNYDPAVLERGARDTSKWPHAGVGKWINAGPPLALVTSKYKGEGFEPLAEGLGGLRLTMPADKKATQGAQAGQDGTTGAHAMIFLPEPHFGRLDRLFVRYYVRLGLPYRAEPRDRIETYRSPGASDWTSMGGKFGIVPDHSTSIGGVSGTSGGGGGWQMRLSWSECDAGVDGPDERGWAPGFHLYDFQERNPQGHRYGAEQPNQFSLWGQRGGLGAVLYAGHWYCIETEIRLNRVLTSPPGYLPDGELRAWVDGKLVYERTGMVFRALPRASMADDPSRLSPSRELGVKALWLNWFHGGRTPNTIDRTMFYTGLAWGTEYIGPMTT